MPVELTVISNGERAARLLRALDDWTVAAVFQRSLYVRNGERFLCVGGLTFAHGPLNVLVRTFPVLAPGDRCHFARTGAAEYGPPRWPEVVEGAVTSDRLTALSRAAIATAPREGFLLAAEPGKADDPLMRKAADGLSALRSGAFDAAAMTLAGLGHGLTPSGDDVLAGALLMPHARGRIEQANALADAVRRIAPQRTSPLSFALLEPACDGEANEAVARSIDALLRDKPPQAVIQHLAKVGATSGFDILAGMLVAAGL